MMRSFLSYRSSRRRPVMRRSAVREQRPATCSRRLGLEVLEDRRLLSATGGLGAGFAAFDAVKDTAPVAVDDEYSTDADAILTMPAPGFLANDTDDGPLEELTVVSVDISTTRGVVAWEANGNFGYSPNGQFDVLKPEETDIDTFCYTVRDAQGGTDTATVTITILGVNDAPVAGNDDCEATEDNPVEVAAPGLLANDTDADPGDELTVVEIDMLGTWGNVTWSPDGGFEYDPFGVFEDLGVGETDGDSFRYTVSDGNGGTDTATVSVTIIGVNDAPEAENDAYTIDADQVLTITAPGLLANDSDVDLFDTPALDAVDVSGTTGQVTSWAADGSFVYDPGGEFDDLLVGHTATDTFLYTAIDPHGGSDTAVVTITIWGVREEDPIAPVAHDDAYDVSADQELVVSPPGVLANDEDENVDDVLTVSEFDPGDVLGEVFVRPDGGFTYDAGGQFDSLAVDETATETFHYTVSDSHDLTDTGEVTITVHGVNEPPEARDDAYSTDENAPLTIGAPGLLDNDDDPDATDVLTVTLLDASATQGMVTWWDTHGRFTYDPNGQFDYLAENETATDRFSYTVDDGHGGSATATVTITILGRYHPDTHAPVANDDHYTMRADERLFVMVPLAPGLLGNDTDEDPGDQEELYISAEDHSGTQGVVVVLQDGSFGYDPFGLFDNLRGNETAEDSFCYTVRDRDGRTDTATVTITIEGVWDPPVAEDDDDESTYWTWKDETLTIAAPGPLGNDTDPDPGDVLILTAADTTGTLGVVSTWSEDGSFVYDPDGQFDHLTDGQTATDTFAYTVGDGHGNSDVGTVTVTIRGRGQPNQPPEAADDARAVEENALLVVFGPGVLENDTDPDPGDQLTVSAVDTSMTCGLLVAWSSDGSFIYDPNGQYEYVAAGETADDTFRYTARDPGGLTDTATVTITIEGVNDPPVAEDDAFETDEDTPLTIDPPGVLENDHDPDASDELNVSGVSIAGTRGRVTVGADGRVLYDPDDQFEYLGLNQTATDTFAYTIDDGHGATDTATVIITIHGRHDGQPPVAYPDEYDTDADRQLLIPAPGLLDNDQDPDVEDPDVYDELAVGGTDMTGMRGIAAVLPDGSLGYNPFRQFDALRSGETAVETFGYTVCDSYGLTDSAVVTITIHGVEDPPVPDDDQQTTEEDAPLDIPCGVLLANDDDPDLGDTLAVVGVDGSATAGVVSFDEMKVTYDPNGAFDYLPVGVLATDTFRYTVMDSAGLTGEATVTVTIVGVNDTATITGRHLFYNNSFFDGKDPNATAGDDGAIAPDKVALLPGQTATFENYTSFGQGINGVMIDVRDPDGTPSVDAFEFRVGNDDHPGDWIAAPDPASITIRPAAGVDGSDRVTVVWPDYSILKQWVQVTVRAAGADLEQDDVFYFGNAVGEGGNSTADAQVNATDMLLARNNPRNFLNPAEINFPYDYNRDARVNATDMLLARNNQTHFLDALKLITVPAVGGAADVKGVLEPGWQPGGRQNAAPLEMDWVYELDSAQSKHGEAAARPWLSWMPNLFLDES
ncbi:MAG: cadherin-like domain-containing protein [Pirellulales bacterium]|nr:cadherin-like domain-containing protein [Pirellulales bacterium]